jgi:hypothetical protein
MSHLTNTGPVRPITEQPWDLETAHIHEQIVYQVGSLISLGVSLLNSLICLRFLFLLLDANRTNEFARFVFITTEPFLAIFQDLTTSPSFNGIEVELISLISITLYSLLAWLSIKFIEVLFAYKH